MVYRVRMKYVRSQLLLYLFSQNRYMSFLLQKLAFSEIIFRAHKI